MFEVNSDKTIDMHRGNTGVITVRLLKYDFSNVNAIALFSVKKDGKSVKEEIHEIENNAFVVSFINEDTDYLTPGQCEYDVTVIIDPVYSETSKEIDGETIITRTVTSGRVVRTLNDPLAITIRRTVATV